LENDAVNLHTDCSKHYERILCEYIASQVEVEFWNSYSNDRHCHRCTLSKWN